MLSGAEPLCMSFLRLGMTNATVGRVLKSMGKSVNRRFEEAAAVVPFGTLEKLIQGTCLRAYRPSLCFCEPIAGRDSEYPLKERPARINCSPRLLATRRCFGILSRNPTP